MQTNLSQAVGGGVGVLDRGKLATSRLTANDLIEPNGWSGDNCTAVGTRPLKIKGMFRIIVKTFWFF